MALACLASHNSSRQTCSDSSLSLCPRKCESSEFDGHMCSYNKYPYWTSETCNIQGATGHMIQDGGAKRFPVGGQCVADTKSKLTGSNNKKVSIVATCCVPATASPIAAPTTNCVPPSLTRFDDLVDFHADTGGHVSGSSVLAFSDDTATDFTAPFRIAGGTRPLVSASFLIALVFLQCTYEFLPLRQ